jgi:hypothetical protein
MGVIGITQSRHMLHINRLKGKIREGGRERDNTVYFPLPW